MTLAAEPEALPHRDPDGRPDKSAFTLFHPTPRELMRPMSTDRPDKTESPYTVDAGHLQVEMDLINYAYTDSRLNGESQRINAYAVAPANLKLGLLNHIDLQVIVEPYVSLATETPGTGESERVAGFGDVLTRLKWNVWGNDGGPTALALMPFVRFPTHADRLGEEEGAVGMIVPFALELPSDWGLGAMTQVTVFNDASDDDAVAQFVNTVTVGHSIIGSLAGYLEFYSAVSTRADIEWIGTVDLGLTYQFTDDFRLDGGLNIGVTESAPDLNPFLGLSVRF
jgi:hypothetical protein